MIALISQAARRSLLVAFLLLVTAASAAAGNLIAVKVRLNDLAEAARLAAAGFDVAGVDRAAMTAGVVATPADLARLSELGYAYESREELAAGASLQKYTDPAEMEAFLDRVAARYPLLAKKYVLADGLPEGHRVTAMKITLHPELEHDRPAFILDAQHHAREVMTPEIARDMINYLTSRYATNPRVRRWVNRIEIWIVPSVNPDGTAHVFTDESMWRKNRSTECGSRELIGVDLNRNYPFGWGDCPGGSGSDCAEEDYRGPSAGSEKETQGMISLINTVRALFGLSYHAYGEYLLYPLGCDQSAERGPFRRLALLLNAKLKNDEGWTGEYLVGTGPETLYSTDGTSDDTEYGTYGTYAYTIEVNASDFQPDYDIWRNVTVQRQRTAWQFFLDRTLSCPSIRGRVKDAVSGDPLTAAVKVKEVVFTHGETTRHANKYGRFFWLAEPGHTYHLTISAPGHRALTRTVTVGAGNAPLEVSLQPL